MKKLAILVILSLSIAACDARTPQKAEQDDGSVLYRRCHEHETYGAHMGAQLYCMVPIERMESMFISGATPKAKNWSIRPHIGWYCVAMSDGECVVWSSP